MTHVINNVVFLNILTSLLLPSTAKQLVAVEVSTKLPSTRYSTSAIYDGKDAIYIIGGMNIASGSILGEIVKFTISTEEVQLVASVPTPMTVGSASFDDRTGDIYVHHAMTYFTPTDRIYRFTPSTNMVELVGTRTIPNYNCAAVPGYANPEEIFVIGGDRRTNIVIFNMENHTISKVGDLVKPYFFAAAVADHTGSAILFGNDYLSDAYPPARLNLTSLATTYGSFPLPYFVVRPAVVWNGSYAYLFGGYNNISAGHYPHSIIQTDPNTLTYSLLPVANFPGNDTEALLQRCFREET